MAKKDAIQHRTKETAKEMISRTGMSMNRGHHKCPQTTQFKDTGGSEARNNCEEADNVPINACAFCCHYMGQRLLLAGAVLGVH